jgi:ribonuclease P protein component
MIGRLHRPADFQRLLATPMCSRSAHFAVHHLSALPTGPARALVHASSTDLSTDLTQPGEPSVDKSTEAGPQGYWLGSVVPKRHARRAVTRNLLRRQIRTVMGEQLPRLAPGLWLVRLRVPYPTSAYPSAASHALRRAVRLELGGLFERAAQRLSSRAS